MLNLAETSVQVITNNNGHKKYTNQQCKTQNIMMKKNKIEKEEIKGPLSENIFPNY